MLAARRALFYSKKDISMDIIKIKEEIGFIERTDGCQYCFYVQRIVDKATELTYYKFKIYVLENSICSYYKPFYE